MVTLDGEILPLVFNPPTRTLEKQRLGFYTYNFAPWDTASFPIQYYINPNAPGCSGIPTQVTAAFNDWENEAASTLDFTYVGTTTTTNAYNWDENAIYWKNCAPETYIANTYQWSSGGWPANQAYGFDIQCNTNNIQWSTTQEATKMDVQNILKHEIGHAIGLDHLNYNNPWLDFRTYVMWRAASVGERKSLQVGDKSGAQYQYPQYTKPSTTITQPLSGSHVRKQVSFEIRATASCIDGINRLDFKMTKQTDGQNEPDSGWLVMSYRPEGYWTATYTPSSVWTTGNYYLEVRALSNRATASQRMYGYFWETIILDP